MFPGIFGKRNEIISYENVSIQLLETIIVAAKMVHECQDDFLTLTACRRAPVAWVTMRKLLHLPRTNQPSSKPKR